jgi:riboflavin biosynthesis protein RibD
MKIHQNTPELAFFCFKLALNYSQYSHISNPNPHVGCVLWHTKMQQVVSIGRTQNYGHAHAEFIAIETAQKKGIDLKECILFVTLEPCAHHGKTPPCVNKIIEAGIPEVCVLLKDPYPKVNGKGMAILQQNQINAYYLEDFINQHCDQEYLYLKTFNELKTQANSQMASFLKYQNTQKPWIRLKFAISLDGFMALESGVSKWLTSPLARAHNQSLRARADVILSTFKTVVADNAKLDVRLEELLTFFNFQQYSQNHDLSFLNHVELDSQQKNYQRIAPDVLAQINDLDDLSKLSQQAKQPERWIFDGSARLLNQNFYHKNQDLAVYQNHLSNPQASQKNTVDLKINQLNTHNAKCIYYDPKSKLTATDLGEFAHDVLNKTADIEKKILTHSRYLDFHDLIDLAISENKYEIHIEAGATFTQYILKTGLFDELVIYQAPILLGKGLRPWPIDDLYQNEKSLEKAHQHALTLENTIQLGSDICFIYMKKDALHHK